MVCLLESYAMTFNFPMMFARSLPVNGVLIELMYRSAQAVVFEQGKKLLW